MGVRAADTMTASLMIIPVSLVVKILAATTYCCCDFINAMAFMTNFSPCLAPDASVA